LFFFDEREKSFHEKHQRRNGVFFVHKDGRWGKVEERKYPGDFREQIGDEKTNLEGDED
jgi:hypothetical protein